MVLRVLMIVHLNFLPGAGATEASSIVSALFGLLDQGGRIEPELLPHLRVHLDWLQYKGNFREPVSVRRGAGAAGEPLALAEVAIDVRQARPERLGEHLAAALTPAGAVVLAEWTPLSGSLVWQCNRLFWQRLADWERQSGRGFEAALPSGRSDANHPEAVADGVADFWTLLVELDKARSTSFYPRLRFLLGDYSLPTLDRAMSAVGAHQGVVNAIAMDALNPMRALSFLRYKILYIHLPNVYDNLPVDELVRRDGQLYLVEVRPYLSGPAAHALCAAHGLSPAELPSTVARLLEVGPDLFGDRERGAAFWRQAWEGLRLEERLRLLEGIADAPLPSGLGPEHLEDLLATAPADIRFHVSRGAVESFVNTVPLLHPRGFLQVQDIFVTTMDEYRQGFRGPGKLDGSVVNWVNGALLRAVGARAGFDVHFAPFRYRPGSRTSILYTTLRE